MQITRTADYALRVVVHLAGRRDEGPVAASEIAAEQDIPRDYVAKVLQALSRGGIVHSVPGRGGGAVLMRDPGEITVLDVVQAADGPVTLNRCLVRPGECPRDRFCAVHSFWHEVQEALVAKLSSRTVADFRDAEAAARSTSGDDD